MNFGAVLGGVAAGAMAGKKMGLGSSGGKTVNPGSDVTDKARDTQNRAMSGDQSSSDENQYYANGGMIGPLGRPATSHCTGAGYDAGGRDVGKKR